MSVIFEARIKNKGESPHDWYIELTDTVMNKKEECSNLEEFSKKSSLLARSQNFK